MSSNKASSRASSSKASSRKSSSKAIDEGADVHKSAEASSKASSRMSNSKASSGRSSSKASSRKSSSKVINEGADAQKSAEGSRKTSSKMNGKEIASDANARKSRKTSKTSNKAETPRSVCVSSISNHDAASDSVSGKVKNLMDHFRNDEHAVKRGNSEAAETSLPLINRPRSKEAAATLNSGPPVVTTREELSALLATNDELRRKLFESSRAERYPNVPKRGLHTNRSASGHRQQKKTVASIQQSMRREWMRQDLRGEHAYLIAQRNELRHKVANQRRLHAYFALIEECRGDIVKLTDERRMLSLEIRQNEKILTTKGTDQELDVAYRRLADAIKADSVLAQRSLQKAQNDAAAAEKMHQDVQQRIEKLEERLAESENGAAPATNDLELRHLQETYLRKAQNIQRLKKQLRAMKSQLPKISHPNEEKGNPRSEKNEREYLTNRIRHLRAELDTFTSKPVRSRSARRRSQMRNKASVDTPLSNKNSIATRAPSARASSTKGRSRSRDANKSSNASTPAVRHDANPPPKAAVGLQRDSIDSVMEDLKRRVEQRRFSGHTPLECQRDPSETSAHTAPKRPSRRSSSGAGVPTTDSGDQVRFLEDTDFAITESASVAPLSVAPKQEETLNEKENVAAPPWFDDDDDDGEKKNAVLVPAPEPESQHAENDATALPPSGGYDNDDDDDDDVTDEAASAPGDDIEVAAPHAEASDAAADAPGVDTAEQSDTETDEDVVAEPEPETKPEWETEVDAAVDARSEPEEKSESEVEEDAQEETKEDEATETEGGAAEEAGNFFAQDDITKELDAPAEADAAPPAPAGEPSWLDFD
ncbi:hypothetical protein DQ04_00281130 [Trypanosoma grayi]|uniref:hypothetical protein n=1 Tax=Trypanosoma grayi TaxID=71804 RepID=UPI0004F3FB61|nr:hypothetical protein DQ04_00281130 [Trypanosoma grayi]KEG14850.1 hypothetical protein DQ04_00281130 [Trypanosoma grayi]